MMSSTTPTLLDEAVVYDALASCNAAFGVADHHIRSYDHLLTQQLPQIIKESPQIFAQTPSTIHLLTTLHVHVDVPVAKTDGGFYDWIRDDEARMTRHTLSNPVVVDVGYDVYSNAAPSKHVAWETVSAEDADRQIRAGGGAALPPAPPLPPPKWTQREEHVFRQVVEFQLPAMVHAAGSRTDGLASLTPNARYDCGGYFLVKGSEKIALPQKHPHTNKVFVTRTTKGPGTWTLEFRACHSGKFRSTSTLYVTVSCGPRGCGPLKGVVRIPFIAFTFPVAAIAAVLGFSSAEAVATSAATGGALSGVDPVLPPAWATPEVNATRQWVLALLRDDAYAWPDFFAMSRKQLLAWMGERGTTRKTSDEYAKYAAHLMANEFLPQMGPTSGTGVVARKSQAFAYFLYRLAHVARGLQEPDDRDHAGNKQYDLAGQLIAVQVQQMKRLAIKRIAAEVCRISEQGRTVDVPSVLGGQKRTTDALVYALSTGKWGARKGGSTQTGVAQLLTRTNTIANLSHVRRLNTPMKREGKQPKPRQLHRTQWGLECPAETPEGQSCGLVNQLAQCTLFCNGYPANRLIRQCASALRDAGVQLVPLVDDASVNGEGASLSVRPNVKTTVTFTPTVTIIEHAPEAWEATRAGQAAADAVVGQWGPAATYRLVVNGYIMGFVGDGGKAAAAALRTARRAGRLPFDVAIELLPDGQNVLNVTGEPGGRRRALFVLDKGADGQPSLDRVARIWAAHRSAAPEAFWRALVTAGAVEYVSKHEEENGLVFQTPTGGAPLRVTPDQVHMYTHCEIHPSAILGLPAALIPFSEHNQAPRVTYSTAMMKQYAGAPGPEIPYTTGMRLLYPQRPLVATWASVMTGIHSQPHGSNVWVLVNTHEGLNQEDAVCVNEDACASGLFATAIVTTHVEDCHSGTGADAQRFEKPPPYCFGLRTGNYDKLGKDGFVATGTLLRGGDVYIGKIMAVNEIGCVKRKTILRDQSVLRHKRDQPARVDETRRCPGRDGREVAAVRMHTVRFVQVGDKVTSFSGQKGVVGAVVPARDMPYAEDDGMVPDVVMNPHAFPSRMTDGQPYEAGVGLVCAKQGVFGDGTPFRRPSGTMPQDVAADLMANGFTECGDRVMRDGKTGARLACRLFFGPVHYFRVKQMVADKHHVRARGPVHPLTQQAMEGRSKDGGLRIGEMERDCIQSHGAAFTVMDRLMYSADFTVVPVCKTCGIVASAAAPRAVANNVVGSNELGGYCPRCQGEGRVYNTPMPYIAKLIMHELQGMHLKPQLLLDTDNRTDVLSAAAVGVRRNRALDPVVLRPRVAERAKKSHGGGGGAGWTGGPVQVPTNAGVPVGFGGGSAGAAWGTAPVLTSGGSTVPLGFGMGYRT
jgi:DNA-directed RNA polymerase II subunit RPB2